MECALNGKAGYVGQSMKYKIFEICSLAYVSGMGSSDVCEQFNFRLRNTHSGRFAEEDILPLNAIRRWRRQRAQEFHSIDTKRSQMHWNGCNFPGRCIQYKRIYLQLCLSRCHMHDRHAHLTILMDIHALSLHSIAASSVSNFSARITIE